MKIVKKILNSDMKNIVKINRVRQQEIKTIFKDSSQELQIKKSYTLKRLAIDPVMVIKGQGSYYVVLVDKEWG